MRMIPWSHRLSLFRKVTDEPLDICLLNQCLDPLMHRVMVDRYAPEVLANCSNGKDGGWSEEELKHSTAPWRKLEEQLTLSDIRQTLGFVLLDPAGNFGDEFLQGGLLMQYKLIQKEERSVVG